MLTGCRYLALIYAAALAVAETILNASRGEWQFAPLWIIDYAIAAYLLAGFWATRRGQNVPVLMSAFALSVGVMYMALFLNLDPALPSGEREQGGVVFLMGLALAGSLAGLIGTTVVWRLQEKGRVQS